MSRGNRLDLFIGAQIEDGWNEVQEKKSSSKNTLLTPQKHQLFFSKEKRRGKVVTLVGEFQLEKNAGDELLKKLKKKLACGGSFKDGFMEFQGELKEKLRSLLVDEGFGFKPKH